MVRLHYAKGETAIDREVSKQQYQMAVLKYKTKERKKLKKQLKARRSHMKRIRKSLKKKGLAKTIHSLQKSLAKKKRKSIREKIKVIKSRYSPDNFGGGYLRQ